MQQKEQILRQVNIFSLLDHPHIVRLAQISRIISFKRDNILFYEGDTPKNLYILLDGQIRIFKTSNFNEITLHILNPINLVAEMVILENIPFPASAIFNVDSKILSINYSIFKEEFLGDKTILLSFVKSLSNKIKILESIVANKLLKLEERLARYLIKNVNILDQLTQRQIAKDLQITPETLNRKIKSLRNKGILGEEKYTLKIVDIEALRSMCN